MTLAQLFGIGVLGCLGLVGSPKGWAAPDCPPEPAAPTPAQREQVKAQARDRGFLWRVSKADRVSYLYGTLHVGKLSWSHPGPTVRRALQDSDVLALELDMQDPDIQAGLQQGMTASASAPPLPAPLAQRLQAQLDAVCLSPEQQAQLRSAYRPEIVLITVTMLSVRRDGLEAAHGADQVLGTLAHEGGQTVLSLEDPASQMALLSADSPEALHEMLDVGLRELEDQSARRGVRRVAAVWADSRHAELARYAEWCDCMDTPAQREQMVQLLDERNVRMAERIDTLHASGQRVFVAVGSLHMVGPMGLPALLGQRGYQVERVDFGGSKPRR
ncbi:MAG: TraB/GumN family protein [Pseudomonadota bacterium]